MKKVLISILIVFLVPVLFLSGLKIFNYLKSLGTNKPVSGNMISDKQPKNLAPENTSVVKEKEPFSNSEDVLNGTLARFKDPSNIPASIRVFFESGKSLQEKSVYARNLSRNLSRDERDALYYYLFSMDRDFEHAEIKNEILNKLRNQIKSPEELPEMLMRITRSEQMDVTMRAYAVQHIAPMISEKASDSPILTDTLKWAVSAPQEDIAVTALLAVNRVLEEGDDFSLNKDFLVDNALKILKDNKISDSMKATVLQICATNDASGSMDYAKSILENPPDSVILKVSSIATIGQRGNYSDIPALEKILEDEKSACCKVAVDDAIKNIKNRYAQK